MMKRNKILILLLITILYFSSNQNVFSQAVKQIVGGKVEIEDDDVEGTILVIEKNKAFYKKMVLKGDGKFEASITFQAEYVFSFEKKNYVTKKVAISTKMPPGILDEGYDPINFKISLFKQYDGLNTVIFNQPVARYKYDEQKDDFVYDTDYTKTIMSEIAKVEAAVEEKKKEEKINKTNVVSNEAKSNASKSGEDTKNNPGSGNDSRQQAEVGVGKDDPNSKSGKAKQDEEWKKKLAAKGGKDNNADSFDKQNEENEKRKLKAKQDEESRKKAQATAEEEARRKAKEKADEEANRIAMAKLKSDENARKLAEAKAKSEEEQRKLLGAAKFRSYLSKIYPLGITIEIKKDQWKETKRIIVNRDSLANEYSQVTHSWGGKFFFKNGETVSQAIFIKETTPRGTESVYTKQE